MTATKNLPADVWLGRKPNRNEKLAMAIRDEGCKRLGRTLELILASHKPFPVAHDRQVIMAACRLGTPASFPELGRVFNRHHTTIVHDVREARRRWGLGLLDAEQVRLLEWAASYQSEVSSNGNGQPTRRK